MAHALELRSGTTDIETADAEEASVELVGEFARFRSLQDAGLGQAWQALAEAAGDPNPFAESWMLLPALRHMSRPAAKVRLLGSADAHGHLSGVVPLVPHEFPFGRMWSIWTHVHYLDSTPLVRAGEEQGFCSALFKWLHLEQASVLWWPGLPLDTGFATHLLQYLQRTDRAWFTRREKQRPLLKADELSVDGYLKGFLSARRRGTLGRKRRRISELGKLEFRTFAPGDDVTQWVDAFLDLEASGWKGKAGSAIKCRPAEEAFFRAAVQEGVQGGRRVAMHALKLDDRPIAMTVNIGRGGAFWGLRFAHDETYSKYSPGVLATIDETCASIENLEIRWVDSCNPGDNESLAELWPHRRPVADIIMAVDPGARARIGLLRTGHRMGRTARAALLSAAKMLGRIPGRNRGR